MYGILELSRHPKLAGYMFTWSVHLWGTSVGGSKLCKNLLFIIITKGLQTPSEKRASALAAFNQQLCLHLDLKMGA